MAQQAAKQQRPRGGNGNGVERRLTAVETRLTGVETRLTKVETRLEATATREDLERAIRLALMWQVGIMMAFFGGLVALVVALV